MANDIIGTPVERVIPEGWSVVREEKTRHDDLAEWGQSWDALGCNCIGLRTDERGFMLFEGRFHLVIRRNAPVVEPSVEDTAALKARIAKLEEQRDACIRCMDPPKQEALIDGLKAKVAELEAENVRLGGLTGVVHDQEETIRWYKHLHDQDKAKVAELELNLAGRRQYVQELEERNARQYKLLSEQEAKVATLDAKDAEIKRLKADVHMWSEANQANLARADAADAKMCSGFQAEVDRLKAEAEQLKRDLKASQARFCVLTQEADRMAAKLVAVRKATVGA